MGDGEYGGGVCVCVRSIRWIPRQQSGHLLKLSKGDPQSQLVIVTNNAGVVPVVL